MPSPWADAGPTPPRGTIERARDELLAGHDEDPRLGEVRDLVRASWVRSRGLLVAPDGLPTLDFAGGELADHRSAHPLAPVIDTIRGLLLPGDAEGSGVVVAIGDAAGRLLWIEGDRAVRRLVGESGFVEGANWSEARVGTAAPGTALALGRSVQVRGAEHFNRHVRPWSCTAAPVRDPETGAIIGVIDVTGRDPAAAPQAQLLVDATVRAVESDLLIARMRAQPAPPRRRAAAPALLRVLGRDRGALQAGGSVLELSARHAEILLMLATHRAGLSAEQLAERVYGDPRAVGTLRPEVVRLRRVLAGAAPGLEIASRPYRLAGALETDAEGLTSLLDRGAHRVAVAAWEGDPLPGSLAPGVAELRDRIRATLRATMLDDAGTDALLAYLRTDAGADDVEAMRLALGMLPARSPRRAGLVARLEALGG
ncbi:helix-turn-helix domain-containing protein [Microbacterium excoecariae]|uniref:helix-turn-helix domain-containing protein n=1 Tax=Microbacterium excoecariae TaxID=2715210 RepID=UPI00140971C8|nr:helix-turn-helix domain-containing protein [Microbacterium excoecariae]NHI15958.1 GAF domain-containing protein [Microbacterium excoecariae]